MSSPPPPLPPPAPPVHNSLSISLPPTPNPNQNQPIPPPMPPPSPQFNSASSPPSSFTGASNPFPSGNSSSNSFTPLMSSSPAPPPLPSSSPSVRGPSLSVTQANAARRMPPSIPMSAPNSMNSNSSGQPPMPQIPSSAASSLLPSSDESPFATPSFSLLTHLSSAVDDQTGAGIWMSKRIGNSLKKLAALEDEYGRNILKLVDSEMAKIPASGENDRILSAGQAWRDFQGLLKELGNYHVAIANRVAMEVSVPVLEFHAGAVSKRKELELEEKKLTKELATQVLTVRYDLDACKKLIIQANAQIAKNEQKTNVPASPAASQSAGSAFFSKLTTKVSKGLQEFTLLSPEQLKEKIISASQKYTKSIESANACQNRFLSTDLPGILNSHELMERTRISTISQALFNFLTIQHQNVPALRSSIEKIPIAKEFLDPDKEIQFLIQGWTHVFGHPPQPTPFVYQLDCSLDDIRQGRYNPQPNSPFNSTLPKIMKIQSASHPLLRVPRILIELRQVLERDRNLSLEGIFRISPAKTEVDEVRKRIDRGEYEFKSMSAHCAASLMKEWMRSLTDPIISERLYPRAIQLAKAENPPDCSDEENNLLIGAADLFNQLDPINREVLIQIAEICSQCLQPENQTRNKMSLEALAIVLTPGLLRSAENDPTLILANVKFETKFAAAIIKSIMKMRNSGN